MPFGARSPAARSGQYDGRALGEANPGRPMATPAETVDAYCVDWCKARCEALGADAKDAWRPEVRARSTIIAHRTEGRRLFSLSSSGRTDRDRKAARPAVPSRPDPEPPAHTRRNTTRRRSSSSPASNPRGCSRTSSARPPPMATGKRATRTPRPYSWSPRGCPRRRAGGTGCSRSSGTRTSRCTR